MSVDPDSIEAGTTLVRSRGVYSLPLPTGAALVDDLSTAFLVVNSTGALIWQFLDGTASIAELCADLADALGAPYEAVLGDTVALVRKMAEKNLVHDPSSGARAMPADVSSVRPRTRRSAGSELGFSGDPSETIAIRVDDRIVGLRVNDVGVRELIRAAIDADFLEGSIVDSDMSLRVAADRGSIPGMHALYRRSECVLRVTGTGRAARAALQHLVGMVAPPRGLVRLHTRVLISRDGVTLVGGRFLEVLDQSSPRLAALGWRVLDGPGPLVDAETLEVVIPPASRLLDAAGCAEIDRRYPRRASEQRVDPGHYRLRNLVVVGTFGGPDPPRDPRSRRNALQPLAHPSGDASASEAERIVERIAERVELRWVAGLDHRELPTVLQELASRRPIN